MGNESMGRHCEVCGREKKPRKIWINSNDTPNSETGIDRVRSFISNTMGGSDTNNHGGDSESSKSTDTETTKEEVFYICPHLPCDGREETIREMERWRMKHDPGRKFSEGKLGKIVAEKVEQEKSDHRILEKNAEEVYRDMVEQDGSEENTSSSDE